MNITNAIEIIDDMRAERGLLFLDMLIEMQGMRANDELSDRELLALRVFMNEGQKLFAPA